MEDVFYRDEKKFINLEKNKGDIIDLTDDIICDVSVA